MHSTLPQYPLYLLELHGIQLKALSGQRRIAYITCFAASHEGVVLALSLLEFASQNSVVFIRNH